VAGTATAEPIRSSAFHMCGNDRPQEAPVKASPVRSRMCAHWLMAERVFHGSARLIILNGLPKLNWELLTEIKRARASLRATDRRSGFLRRLAETARLHFLVAA